MTVKRITFILLVTLILLSIFSACGGKKPNGTYYDSGGYSLTFQGKNYVVKNVGAGNVTESGTFDLVGKDITCHTDDGRTERATYNSVNDTISSGGNIWTKNKPAN